MGSKWLQGCLRSFVVFSLVVVSPDLAPSEDASFVHGTVIVVVSVKDGFVLAGDSRGSRDCQALPGEYEKVFTMGNRTGIAVAGLIGSAIEKDVAESIATFLHGPDQRFKITGEPIEATTAATLFLGGVSHMMSLLPHDFIPDPDRFIAEASSVSINEDGSPEWVTLHLLPVKVRYSQFSELWGFVVHHFDDPPASRVIALGAGVQTVENIINSTDPSDSAAQDLSVTRYRLLRKENRLSELTLGDAELLAQFLVKAAISYSDSHPIECLGIGGDVQMLAVTRKGTEWIHPLEKAKLAAPVPSYEVRVIDSDMFGRLDGVQWARDSVPDGATITFNGDSNVIVSQPAFEGKCKFVLSSEAEGKMPDTANRLKTIFGPHCDVYRQTKGGLIELSTASVVTHASIPIHEEDPYSSLCDRALKQQEKDLSAKLWSFGHGHDSGDALIEEREWLAGTQALSKGERDVLWFKQSRSLQDRWLLFTDEYQRRFVPPAVAMRRELAKRVVVPSQFAHPEGRTPFLRWSELVSELDGLASLLPEKCEERQKAAAN